MQDTQAATRSDKTKWLTKDRLWSFIFWFGMSFGLTLGGFLKSDLKMFKLASFVDWTTLLVIPISMLIFNRTRFIKKDTFCNSEGTRITKKQMPTGCFLLSAALGAGFTFFIAEMVLPRESNGWWVCLIMLTSLFSGFSLYFIVKNCPISILLNYKLWKFEPKSYSRDNWRSGGSSSRSDMRTNPAYSHRPENIYYSSTHRSKK